MTTTTTSAQDIPPPSSDDFRAAAIGGYMIILFCIIGVALWALFARIDSAVMAPGSVSLDAGRQTVQHLEGGIVRGIYVKEGDTVFEGQVLLYLDVTDINADLRITKGQYFFARAAEVRLRAQLAEEKALAFPDDMVAEAEDPELQKILNDQLGQFAAYNETLQSQISLLENKKSLINQEISGLREENATLLKQLVSVNDELDGAKTLYAQQLETKDRVQGLEREKLRLDAMLSRNLTDQAKARGDLADLDLQMQEWKQKNQVETSSALNEVRQKLDDLPNRVKVLDERLKRSQILAPKTGSAQSVKVDTIGQVIRPGEELLEIVPQDDNLIVTAQVSLTDVNDLHGGMKAEVRFPSFKANTTPVMYGEIQSVSNDRIIDEMMRQSYFLVRVNVRRDTIPVEIIGKLRAGMPAEVVIPLGDRTVADYLIQPLNDALRTTFRER